MHRLIAGMLTGDPERQARHLADAADGPDEAVAERLEDAGRRMARRGDGHGAVAAMVRAAALSQRTAGRSRRLAEAAFVGVNLTWDLAQAAELLADARRAAPEIVSPLPAVAATAFLYLNGDGDVDAALRLLVDAIERIPVSWTPPTRTSSRCSPSCTWPASTPDVLNPGATSVRRWTGCGLLCPTT